MRYSLTKNQSNSRAIRLAVYGLMLIILSATFVYCFYWLKPQLKYHDTVAQTPIFSNRPEIASLQQLAKSTKAVKTTKFIATIRPVSSEERVAMLSSGSWRTGCPLKIDDLRTLELSFLGFDSQTHLGKMMVNKLVADSVVKVFKQLYESRYPIKRMELVDKYGADDETSMLADNTSGYNCRLAPPSLGGGWSLHSYGLAIDINPFENPELFGEQTYPKQSKKYADRNLNEKGMILPGDAAVKAFKSIGWLWGGDWPTGQEDYQHFYIQSLRYKANGE